jgi:hypothetical protein
MCVIACGWQGIYVCRCGRCAPWYSLVGLVLTEEVWSFGEVENVVALRHGGWVL